MKKVLYVVLDGMGDLPHPVLGGMTPLEAGETPCMDELAQQGKNGLVYTVGKDIAPESDVAVISILGYEAEKYYTGRGPLECYASGISVEDGNLAYRCNFATMGKEKKIIDRRVSRNLSTEEASQLCQAIKEKVKLTEASFEFKNTIGHRAVLLLRDEKGHLSSRIINTDPAYEKKGSFGVAREKFENVLLTCQPEQGFENDAQAQRAAFLTNEFIEKSGKVLDEEEVNKKRVEAGKIPANVILTRDAGTSLPRFPAMSQLWKMRFGCFVEMPVEKGIALLTGMDVIDLPQKTGDAQKDYGLRAEEVYRAIGRFDGLYIHLKGPDEPAHDGEVLKKKEAIEEIDKYFFARLLPRLSLKEIIIAITADHSTPCILKAHSDDPVPLLIAGGKIEKDGVANFSEKACKSGSLGIILGTEIMPLLVKSARGEYK